MKGEASEFQAWPTPERFYREHASLQFLCQLNRAKSLAPRVITSGRAAGLLVMEYLGDNPTVQDVMFEDDRAQAKQCLIQVGEQLSKIGGCCFLARDFNPQRANPAD